MAPATSNGSVLLFDDRLRTLVPLIAGSVAYSVNAWELALP